MKISKKYVILLSVTKVSHKNFIFILLAIFIPIFKYIKIFFRLFSRQINNKMNVNYFWFYFLNLSNDNQVSDLNIHAKKLIQCNDKSILTKLILESIL